MKKTGIRYYAIAALLTIWLLVTIPNLISFIQNDTIIFPYPIHTRAIIIMLISSILLSFFGITEGVRGIIETEGVQIIPRERLTPALFLLFISIPISYAYIFEYNNQNLSQLILDSAVMDGNFDDIPPGEDPPGWAEGSGNWTAVNDGGNIVYYQDDLSDKEALTISTTGDIGWTDYEFEVDVKFVEGDPSKADRAAIICFRHSGENTYYFMAMRETQDRLDIYKHGTGGGGHNVGSISCVLEIGVWYHVNVTILNNNVWISINDVPYFVNLDMQGTYLTGSVGIGTEYYKVMFDNIHVEVR